LRQRTAAQAQVDTIRIVTLIAAPNVFRHVILIVILSVNLVVLHVVPRRAILALHQDNAGQLSVTPRRLAVGPYSLIELGATSSRI
jgi:hypothetical protein